MRSTTRLRRTTQSGFAGRIFLTLLVVGLGVNMVLGMFEAGMLFFPAQLRDWLALHPTVHVIKATFLAAAFLAYLIWVPLLQRDLEALLPGYRLASARDRWPTFTRAWRMLAGLAWFRALAAYLDRRHDELRKFRHTARAWIPFIDGLALAIVLWLTVAGVQGMVSDDWEVVGETLVPVAYLLLIGITVTTMQLVEYSRERAVQPVQV